MNEVTRSMLPGWIDGKVLHKWNAIRCSDKDCWIRPGHTFLFDSQPEVTILKSMELIGYQQQLYLIVQKFQDAPPPSASLIDPGKETEKGNIKCVYEYFRYLRCHDSLTMIELKSNEQILAPVHLLLDYCALPLKRYFLSSEVFLDSEDFE